MVKMWSDRTDKKDSWYKYYSVLLTFGTSIVLPAAVGTVPEIARNI